RTGAKYGELRASVNLPHLAAVCKAHGVTTSTVLRLAWALVLRHFTRSEHVVFGSVVSGRDGGVDGIDEIVGVLINTIVVPAHLPLDASVASALAAMQSFSADAINHSDVGLVNAQRAAGMASSSDLFDTIMVFENYPTAEASSTTPTLLETVRMVDFWDTCILGQAAQADSKILVNLSYLQKVIGYDTAKSFLDMFILILGQVCDSGVALHNITTENILFNVLVEAKSKNAAEPLHLIVAQSTVSTTGISLKPSGQLEKQIARDILSQLLSCFSS
ncbi:hypothetical protein HK105_209426, partial [Polyrhizophydium stewartii]